MQNKRLYLFLVTASVAITILALLIPASNPWFTLISSIGCGGIASTVVAFLIELSNWKTSQKKTSLYREAVLRDFYGEFESGISVFVRLFVEIDNGEKPLQKKHWLTWVECCYNCLEQNESYIQYFNDSCGVLFDGIEKQVRFLSNQKAILLDQEIIEPEDAEAVSEVLDYISFIRSSGSVKQKEANRSKMAAQFNRDHCRFIFEFLEKAPILKKVNEQEVGALLYEAFERMRENGQWQPIDTDH